MDFSQVVESVGGNGRYQRRLLYLFLTPYSFILPFFNMSIIFLVSVPDHWCHVPGRLGNVSLQQWKQMTIPREVGPDGQLQFSHCLMYARNTSTLVPLAGNTSSEAELVGNQSTTGCLYGWEFDQSDYSRTAATDNDWVCEEGIKSTNILSLNAIGVVIGNLVFGPLADRIGRRPVTYLTVTVVVVFRTVSLFLSRYYVLFAVLHVVACTCYPMVYYAPVTIVTELSDKNIRGRIVTVTFVAWVFGMSFIPFISWMSGDWVVIGLLTTLPGLLVFCYWRLVPESPRWLISQGRLDDAADVLKQVARVNKKRLPDNFMASLTELMKRREKQTSIVSLLRSRRLAMKTILVTITYMVNTVVYYGLQWNISNMGGNEFLNYFLLSIIELPSSIVGWWIVDRFGRRWTHSLFFALTLLCCVINAAISTISDLQLLLTVVCILGKFCITVTFLVLCVQAIEQFPTCARSTGISFCSMVSQLVTMSAAYIVHLGNIHLSIPYLIFSGICMMGAVAASFLPETLNQPLTETLEEAENFGRNRKFWSWRAPCSADVGEAVKEETVAMVSIKNSKVQVPGEE